MIVPMVTPKDPFLSDDASVDAFTVPSGHIMLTGLDDVTGKGTAVRITPDVAIALATWLLEVTR